MAEPEGGSTSSSDDVLSDEDDFGIKLPTYISALKNILLQYPENGQILKEILQNAEDAKAKHVKFLVDMNSYGKDPRLLQHKDLAQFQGPALYAYNDANFSPDDWEGVQRIQDSIKEKDPMSIGRFGLGFKSIYHITDLPSILSEGFLGFFDPFQRYFSNADGSRGTGKLLNFVKKPKLLSKYRHQFEPYIRKFGFDSDSHGKQYQGTIFRLPLRMEPSALSESVHDEASMRHLYDSFIRDAHITLLFLHNIEEVEFLWQAEGQHEPTVYYKVQVSSQDREEAVANGRCKIVDQCQSFTFPLEVTVTSCERSEKKTSIWLVSEIVDRKSSADERRQLAIPVVGVAMPLDITETFIGRIFCYLPLSVPEEGNLVTGLPFHVHGTFSLSPDRHHILAPTAGETWDANSDLIWNQMLIEELFPKAYRHLLLALVAKSKKTSGLELLPSLVMNALADPEQVKAHWHTAASEVLKDALSNEEVLYSACNNGCWVRSSEAVLEDKSQSPTTQKLLRQVAIQCGMKVVEIPSYIHTYLLEEFSEMQQLSPRLLSAALHGHADVINGLSRQDKLLLLRYLLEGTDMEDVLLEGLPLLPLADCSFTDFTSCSQSKVYIGSSSHPSHLLRGMERHILDPTLDDTLFSFIENLADEGCYQLKRLDCADVLHMLPNCIPHEWLQTASNKLEVQDGGPDIDWLEMLWEYLARQPSVDCRLLLGLPILPDKTSAANVTLHSLHDPPTLVLKSASNIQLSDNLCQALQIVGLDVIKNVSASIRHVVSGFICMPEPLIILDTLCQSAISKKKLKMFSSETSPESKKAFLEFVASVSQSLTKPHKALLVQLPIFQCEGDKSNFVTIQAVKLACPEKPACKTRLKLLDLSSDLTEKLASSLGAHIMTSAEYLQNYVFSTLQKLPDSEVEVIVQFLLSRWTVLKLQDPNIVDAAKAMSLAFNETNKRKRPSELFNPEDSFLRQLFEGEPVFPVVSSAVNRDSYITFLRELGLKGHESIERDELVQTTCKIGSFIGNKDKYNVMEHKACSVLEVIRDKPHLISDKLKTTTWLPVLQRPADYPANLGWKGTDQWATPNTVAFCKDDADRALLLGSVCPLCKYALPQSLMEYNENKMASLLVAQLSNITESYSSSEKDLYLAMVIKIYRFLSEMEAEMVLPLIQSHRLIWHGDGFAYASELCIEPPEVEVYPYQYVLPAELTKVKGFICQLGVKTTCGRERLIAILHQIGQKWQEELKCEAPEEDMKIVLRILSFLSEHIDELDDDEQACILVPVICDDSVHMVPLDQATYAPAVSEGDHSDQSYKFLHPDVALSTVDALRIQKLETRIIGGEGLEFTDFGQSESLTDRLKNILQGYQDGYAVPKELIQNADDAGATVVKLMWDERKNSKHRKRLFSREMAGCHGPALWAYNDALFKEQDYKNIASLGSGNKGRCLNKIGKFGLGFNSCYNLTDIPSFISSESLVILDPNLMYMDEHVKNKSKPGIRINIVNNHLVTRKYPDQFKPYQGVFDCNIQANEAFCGTLFRFPLRDKDAAKRSEINSLVYDRTQMINLLEILIENASELLLFTQSVRTVELYHLPSDAKSPQEAVKVFQVGKSPEKVVSSEGFGTHRSGRGSLEEAVHVFHGQRGDDTSQHMNKTEIMKVQTVVENTTLFKNTGTTKHHWLISHWLGEKESKQKAISASYMGLTPLASVALPVHYTRKGCSPIRFADIDKVGKIFCYLPLPQESGLPVHINGSFAVHSDRQGLAERSSDSLHHFEAEWNESLMQDAVMEAYLKLLCTLDGIIDTSVPETPYWLYWPFTPTVPVAAVKLLVRALCEKMAQTSGIPVVHSGHRTLYLDDALLIDEGQLTSSGVEQEFKTAIAACSANCVFVPNMISQCFHWAGVGKYISSKYRTMEQIFIDIILPNLESVPKTVRNAVVMYAVKRNNPRLNKALQQTNCIPVDEAGTLLKKPTELVSPDSRIGELYSLEEGKFPAEEFKDHSITPCLVSLGMQVMLDWAGILERANSIKSLCHIDGAMNRYRSLILYMDSKISSRFQCPDDVKAELVTVNFIPAIPKPENHPLPWRWSDSNHLPLLVSATTSYLCNDLPLVSASHPLVSTTSLPRQVQKLLGLDHKTISIETVIAQLQELVTSPVTPDTADFALQIYLHLGYSCSSQENMEMLQARLSGKAFIFVGGVFYFVHQVGTHFAHYCPPYIQKLPQQYTVVPKIMHFLKVMGYTGETGIPYIMESLHSFARSKDTLVLDDLERSSILNMLSLLEVSMKHYGFNHTSLIAEHGNIPVPDWEGKLKPSTSLCLPDVDWLASEKKQELDQSLVHEDLSPRLAEFLGVKAQRTSYLMQNADMFAFHQEEDLLGRLKHIVESYPFDVDILKEFIQNADDACASEIHFILDTRYHASERVFSDEWQDLQGPALLIYNDSPFTQSDIDGIMKLGVGSKSNDASKIGRYGIGFSSVYHITDVPCFLSCSPELNCLCASDPHCYYTGTNTPGVGYKNLDNSREMFPDVFRTFLPEQLELDSATLFRFPLRTHEMARRSKIKDSTTSCADIQLLFRNLKENAPENLLFLNHLKEVTISEIGSQGNLKELYHCKASVASNDQRIQSRFQSSTVSVLHKMSADDKTTLAKVKPERVSYSLYIHENHKARPAQEWLIVQQFGCDNPRFVVPVLKTMSQAEKLSLNPRAGVAVCIQMTQSRVMGFSGKDPEITGKFFCGISTAEETKLPVHVNGYFSLLFENRREIRKQNAWNELLFNEIVAPCYMEMLELLTRHISQRCNRPGNSMNQCIELLNAYFCKWPNMSSPVLASMAQSFYDGIVCQKRRILPVARRAKSSAVHGSTAKSSVAKGKSKAYPEDETTWLISWVAHSDGNNRAYLFDCDRSDLNNSATALQQVLSDLGLDIIFITAEGAAITNNFECISKPVSTVTRKDVVKFLRSHDNPLSKCNFMVKLPAPVKKTPVLSEQNCMLILKYCLPEEPKIEHIVGLPLLLTWDKKLHVFQSKNENIVNFDWYWLFNRRKGMFVDAGCSRALSSIHKHEDPSVMFHFWGSLSITMFAELFKGSLPNTLSSGKVVSLVPELEKLRLYEIWLAIEWFIGRDKPADPHKYLQPLWELSLVLVKVGYESLLYPVGKWNVVSSAATADILPLLEPVKRLIPILAPMKRGQTYPKLQPALLENNVAASQKPGSILHVLHHCFVIMNRRNALTESYAVDILDYITKHLEEITQSGECKELLKAMPLYKAVNGARVSMLPSTYVVAQVPLAGINLWGDEGNKRFLCDEPSLKKLYEFLGCKFVSVFELYTEFIFLHLEKFSQADRMRHLYFVYKGMADANTQLSGIPKFLQDRKFVCTSSGELYQANQFFDPVVKAFTVFESHKLPPALDEFIGKIFPTSDWLTFLRACGMRHECSSQNLVRYSTQIRDQPEAKGVEVKAEFLLKNIFLKHTYASSRALGSMTILADCLTALDAMTILTNCFGACPELIGSQWKKILDHVIQDLDFVSDVDCKKMLRALPLYLAKYGERVAMAPATYVVPDVPRDGIDIWSKTYHTLFLEDDSKYNTLYKMLGCECLSVAQFYRTFIFQHLEYFTQEQRMIHLHFIWGKIEGTGKRSINMYGVNHEDFSGMLEELKTLDFVEGCDGELHAAHEFCDPENSVYAVMEPENVPPPFSSSITTHFREHDWLRFLRECGMRTRCTSEEILKFARLIEAEGIGGGSVKTARKSRCLIAYMRDEFKNGCLSDAALLNLKDVRFVKPSEDTADLSVFHSSLTDLGDGNEAYVAFSGSFDVKHKVLIWSHAPVIDLAEMRPDIFSKMWEVLGVHEEPDSEMVIRHLKNLSNVWHSNLNALDLPRAEVVFKEIIDFLSVHEEKLSVSQWSELKQLAFVPVENGRKLIKPCCTVLNLQEHLGIPPYLYRLPGIFHSQEAFLLQLGVTKEPSFEQYVNILKQLHHETSVSRDEKSLLLDELFWAKKAMNGFFEQLPGAEDIEVSELYLLSESGKLVSSSRLMVNDVPGYYSRIPQNTFDFLDDSCCIGMTRYQMISSLKSLPFSTIPRFLSHEVTEEVAVKTQKAAQSTSLSQKLQQLVSSPEFIDGIVRVFRHAEIQKGRPPDEEKIQKCIENLDLTKFSVIPEHELFTQLRYNKKTIQNAERRRNIFAEHNLQEGHWHIYIQECDNLGIDELIYISELLSKPVNQNRQRLANIIAGSQLGKANMIIPLLTCEPSEVKHKLDRMNITQLQDITGIQSVHLQADAQCIVPELGATIAEKYHNSLRAVGATECLREKQCVAVANSQGDFVFAKVMEFCTSKDDNIAVMTESDEVVPRSSVHVFSRH